VELGGRGCRELSLLGLRARKGRSVEEGERKGREGGVSLGARMDATREENGIRGGRREERNEP